MKHQLVHFLDGYVVDGRHVRARCTCGFVTLPHATQRPARVALVRGHGLSAPACQLCGRVEAQEPVLRLPAGLTVVHEDGRDLIVCAPGSGGCDQVTRGPAGNLEPGQMSDTRPAAQNFQRAQVHAHQARLIRRAHDALSKRHQITMAQAAAMLEQQARYQALSLVEAARRAVVGGDPHTPGRVN